MKVSKLVIYPILFALVALIACKEEDDTVEEFPNWQATNEQRFANLSDSVKALLEESPERNDWKRIKTWSKTDDAEGADTDYIIVNVKEEAQGENLLSPLYTDTVSVSYKGWLLPSTSYPAGYIFDYTFSDEYDPEVSPYSTFAIGNNAGNNIIDGFATALQNMHKGDRWLVYIPYQLAYGSSSNGSIPAYSMLTFDMILIDFWGARYGD